jgi:hypothetical protein
MGLEGRVGWGVILIASGGISQRTASLTCHCEKQRDEAIFALSVANPYFSIMVRHDRLLRFAETANLAMTGKTATTAGLSMTHAKLSLRGTE